MKTSLSQPVPHFGGEEKTFFGASTVCIRHLKDVVALQMLDFFVAAGWLSTCVCFTSFFQNLGSKKRDAKMEAVSIEIQMKLETASILGSIF